MNHQEPLVSINCAVFNQEKYIRKTLDSFLMQKTDFPFEILIHDDCSSDRTIEIVEEYQKAGSPEIRIFREKENQFQKGFFLAGMYNEKYARGKYVAICEGDDYWCDDTKLQRQVEFLESHPDYSMCVHSGYNCREDGTILKEKFRRFYQDCDISVEKIITSWVCPTASIVYRKQKEPLHIPFASKCVNDDYMLLIYESLQGKVHYMDRLMCVYRNSSNGSTTQILTEDKEKGLQNLQELRKMLFNLNVYTNGKYQKVIHNADLRYQYQISKISGDNKWKNDPVFENLRTIEQHEEQYRKLSRIPFFHTFYNVYQKHKR